MSKKIFFQKCNFNYIYFLLYILSYFIDNVIAYRYQSIYYTKYEKSLTMVNIYVKTFCSFLAFIPFLLRKKCSNKKKEEKIDNDKNINIKNDKNIEINKFIYNDSNIIEINKKNNQNRRYIFIIAFIEFLCLVIYFIYIILLKDLENNNELYFLDANVPYTCIIQFILSYLILKTRLYKHHYFSLILTIIIFVIILILDLINIFKNNAVDYKFYIYYLIYLTFNSIENPFGKKLFLYGFISPYNLLIMKGIILFIFVAIFSIIILIIDINIFSDMVFFLNGIEEIFLRIAQIILAFLEELFFWLIVDRFSPNYFPLALISMEIAALIAEKTQDVEEGFNLNGWDLCIRIILYIILFLGILIHNEIIIINIYGLGSYTKYYLDLKVKNEEIFNDTDNPEVLRRYETNFEMNNIIEESLIQNVNENDNINNSENSNN